MLRVSRDRMTASSGAFTYFNATLVATNTDGSTSIPINALLTPSMAMAKYQVPSGEAAATALANLTQMVDGAWFVGTYPPSVFRSLDPGQSDDAAVLSQLGGRSNVSTACTVLPLLACLLGYVILAQLGQHVSWAVWQDLGLGCVIAVPVSQKRRCC